MKVNVVWITLLLLVAPNRAKELSRLYNKHQNTPEAIAAQKKYDDEHPFPERSFDRIRAGLFWSFLLVLGASVAAAVVGRLYLNYVGPASPAVLELMQYAGVGIILWTTLAKQGWDIQSMDGSTLPEMIDDFLYRCLYVVGSFLLVLAVSMQLAATASK